MTPIEHALAYAARGWRVAPIAPGTKWPRLQAWEKRASTETSEIELWWRGYPDDGVSIVTGAASGLVVIDIDPRHGGDEGWAELEREHGAVDTVEALTGGGGRHLYFAMPEGLAIGNAAAANLPPGIDVRGEGGQVVAPPTLHPDSGRPYAWEIEHDPLDGYVVAELPPWLLELLLRPIPEQRPRQERSKLTLGDSVVDAYNAAHTWPELLVADGWAFHSRRNDAGGEFELWTRPGKNVKDGPSASLYYKGSDVLKVFTSEAAPLRPEETYTKFGYTAAMQHGGDMAAMGRAARREVSGIAAAPVFDSEESMTGQATPIIGRPAIVFNGRQLDDVRQVAVNSLALANEPPRVFVRGGVPTRVRTDEDTRPIIEPFTKDMMRHRLAIVADWFRVNADGVRTSGSPPMDVVADVLAAEGWPFPALTGIAEVPILRPDGTFALDHGYDHATRLFHWRVAEYPPIPMHPTEVELAKAVGVLNDLIADFPFDTVADRANACALLLTGIVRPAIEGQVPMGLLDAPEPGTGKSLLARVATLVTTGRPGAMQAMPANDEELEKRITAMLLAGTTTVIFDNVEGLIKSPVLAGALTADVWRGRMLGQSLSIEVPSRVTWLATGNNINVGGDLARRCYRIRLDARQSQPWRRTDFRHRDLEGYVRDNRAEIVVALCTMVRSWWAAGKPEDDTLPMMGGYAPWVRTIGGILAHAGIAGFLGNLEAFHADADAEAIGWEAFLTAWFDSWSDEIVTVGEVVRRLGDPQVQLGAYGIIEALPDDLAPSWKGNGESSGRFSTKLGRALANRAGRHYGDQGLHIVRHGLDRSKVARYSITARRAGVGDISTNGECALSSNGVQSAGDAGEQVPHGDFWGYPVEKGEKSLRGNSPRDPRDPRAPDWEPF